MRSHPHGTRAQTLRLLLGAFWKVIFPLTAGARHPLPSFKPRVSCPQDRGQEDVGSRQACSPPNPSTRVKDTEAGDDGMEYSLILRRTRPSSQRRQPSKQNERPIFRRDRHPTTALPTTLLFLTLEHWWPQPSPLCAEQLREKDRAELGPIKVTYA